MSELRYALIGRRRAGSTGVGEGGTRDRIRYPGDLKDQQSAEREGPRKIILSNFLLRGVIFAGSRSPEQPALSVRSVLRVAGVAAVHPELNLIAR